MFCSKCGNQINQDEKFCSSCGNIIGAYEHIQPKNEIPKPTAIKKTISKKVIIPVAVIASILVIGLIALVSFFGASAPEREMKKALETNDYYTIMTAYENLVADGKYETAVRILNDYVEDAIDYLNNNFTMSVDEISDDDEINYEILDFLYNNYGDMFVTFYEEYGYADLGGLINSGCTGIEASLIKFENMVASKYQYYKGLYEFNPSFKEDDEKYYYMNALDSFSGVMEEDINYEAAQEKAEEVCDEYINSLIAKADEYIAMGDYSAAVELLNNTILDEEELAITNLKAKIDEVLSSYAVQYATKAEEEFKSGDVNAAIGNIEAAISIYSKGKYEAKLEEYKLYLPFELYKKDNIISYNDVSFYSGCKTANNNKEYCNLVGFSHDDFDESGFIEYDLAGNYSTVSGTTFITLKENFGTDFNGYFEVYGDGKLLYKSTTMRVGVQPQNFSIDVTGVQRLELKTYSNSIYYMNIYISNFVAKKNIPTGTTE